MKRLVLAVGMWVLVVAGAVAVAGAAPRVVQKAGTQKAGAIKVLLLDGQSGGTYHNWRVTTQVMKKELEEAGPFRVTVSTLPEGMENLAGYKPDFGSYGVVVSNYDAPDWPQSLRTALEQYVGGGGGLVLVHAADNAFPGWAEYNRMAGVGGWRGRTEKAGPMWSFDGVKMVPDSSAGSAGSHGNRLPFQVTVRDAQHPIVRGLPAVWMHNSDELYATLRGPGENMTVLATAHSDPANKGTGRDEPMLMVVKYGKGRVFHTTLGHDAAALSCVGFATTFARGTEWAATGAVTQKVPVSFPTANTASVRVDLAKLDPTFGQRPGDPQSFEELADKALVMMRKKAEELKIGGVAVVAYSKGDAVTAWASKMAVVGRMRDDPSATAKGSNLLAIAYAKAAEMADTLKDSGSKVRPPMTGEFGWEGGVVSKGKTGYVIVAFSGGKSADDVSVSRVGVAELDSL